MNPHLHQMTAEECCDIAELLTQHWPAPELTESGFELLVVAIAQSALTLEQAKNGILALMQQIHPFRPQVGELVQASGRNRPAYHRPYLVTAQFEALPPEVSAQHIAAARAALRKGETGS